MKTNVQAMKLYETSNPNQDYDSVNEALATFLGKKQINYSSFFGNKMLLSFTIRKGLPFLIFEKIKKLCPFSENDWAEYLNLSTKTLQRNAAAINFSFKPIHSEKILELAEVTYFGNEVFDSSDQFYQWLNSPSLALAKQIPADLLKDSYGKELVMEELNRIDQGIFA